MARGIHPEVVSKSCAAFTGCENKSLHKYLTPHMCTIVFIPNASGMGNTCVIICCASLRGEEELSEFALAQESLAEQEAEPSFLHPVWCCNLMISVLLCKYFPCITPTVGIILKI